MRVLIVSALFACACAAPSGLAPLAVAPFPVAPLPAVAIPAVAPVNSGDLQAALIDAKVQTEDFLRSVADKQRDAVEQTVVDTNEKVIEVNDQVQEKAVENFWANEEKKWQAFDAVQTAQAQLDGKIASTSDAVAKSVVVPAITPVVSPYSYVYAPGVVAPAVIAPGLIAPGVKAAVPEAKPEEKKEEPKPEEPKEETKSDSVQIESANIKTAEVKDENVETKYVVGQTPLIASFPLSPLKFAQPWAPVVAPGFNNILPFGAHFVAPTVIKTVW